MSDDPLRDFTNIPSDGVDPEEQQQEEQAQEAQQQPEDPSSEPETTTPSIKKEPQDALNEENYDDEDEEDDNIYSSIRSHKLESGEGKEITKKKIVRKAKKSTPEVPTSRETSRPAVSRPERSNSEDDSNAEFGSRDTNIHSDPQMRKRMLLEEKMNAAISSKSTRRRKADEDDLERMQDDKIDHLKDLMIKAANLDVEKNSQGQIATEKLKLLRDVTDILSRADLAISILDNNLLEAVRLWLEPLPDASMPAYQIQKELIYALEKLPIKTDHLIASNIGKVLVFYQRSKRTEPALKKIVDRLIGDWTRPILNKSDSYKDRSIQFHEYAKSRFSNQLASARSGNKRNQEAKTLYEQNAERRKRAAIPSARTAAYKIAPRVDVSLLRRQQSRSAGNDERFKRINQKLTSMSVKKKISKKGGPSIEGRGLGI
ncbi:IWS1 [[Candida] subhashii]|uniref:Transcription factor IWS1 n=1 Tax=[Candida] subhashii TaxID=561895 RepID=A0A8J5QRD5_9ASCO|nr:IWS1 [[Candida] subhashii]KAG7665276.1 IWS1 [[Candida] subhashii]